MPPPDVIVCRAVSAAIRRVLLCPTCAQRRRMAGHLALWYGATLTCLGCGDTWTDGEMHPLPFKPRWREENIAAAREAWASAVSRAEERSWFRAELEATLP